MEFLDVRIIYILLHIFGVILGAGAAFTSDLLFFTCLQDKKFSHDEVGILKTSSRVVWLGILLIIISGVGLFSLDSESLLISTKFQAKMIIVAILIVNGLIFHFIHLPRIASRVGKKFFLKSTEPYEKSYMFLSGVLSVVSWIFVIVLGTLDWLPYSIWTILIVYLTAIILGASAALYEAKKFGSSPDARALVKSMVVISVTLVLLLAINLVTSL